jgi:hypothetical protein
MTLLILCCYILLHNLRVECAWDLAVEHELFTLVGAQKIVHGRFAHKGRLLITSQLQEEVMQV